MANRTIGALWQKKSAAGTVFLSGVVSLGVLGECQVVVFKALEKRSEASPDYIIYASTPRPNGTSTPASNADSEPDEDIPF